jgi:hypothetical protein
MTQEILAAKGRTVGEKRPVVMPTIVTSRHCRDLLHAAHLRHGTGRFTSPLKEGVRCAEDFFALKNPTASAGFEPANLGTKDQHTTSRPPHPLTVA